VAAKTSEIRIYHINYEKGSLKGLEKMTALTLHKKETLSIAFDSSS